PTRSSELPTRLHGLPQTTVGRNSPQPKAGPRSFIFPVGAPAQSLRRSTVGRTSRQQNAVPRSFIFPVGAPAQSLRRSTVGRTCRQQNAVPRSQSSSRPITRRRISEVPPPGSRKRASRK